MEDEKNLLDDEDFEDNVETYQKKKNKFRIYSKSFFLTYPQCPIDEVSFFELFRKLMAQKNRIIRLAVCASEFHNQTEGKHIHLYCEIDKRLHLRDSFPFDIIVEGEDETKIYHPNIQRPKNKVKIIKYISGLTKKKINDEKHVFEYGIEVKKYLYKQLKHIKYVYDDLIQRKLLLTEAVNVESSLITQYTKLKRNLESYWADTSSKEFKSRRISFWIVGPPGIGKSYSVRNTFQDVYIKESNKWWDGYINQKVVLIDDYDTWTLSHYLKIWADNYKFLGEIKGGVVECIYNVLFITSNYEIDEIFKGHALRQAIKRRFNIIRTSDYLYNNYFFLDETIIKIISEYI